MAKKKTSATVGEEYTVLEKVGIYKNYTALTDRIGNYKKNEKVTVTETTTDGYGNTWGNTTSGWFMIYDRANYKTLAVSSKGKSKAEVKEAASEAKDFQEKWKTTSTNWQNVQVNQAFTDMELAEHGSLSQTMQLFGIPYQFLPSVDMRVDETSTILGRKYITNFILNAPIVTFIPGEPTYLPDSKDKEGMTSAFLQASTGNLGPLKTMAADGDMDNCRLYDMKTAYTRYFSLVNVLCRTIATFLELNENPDKKQYKINNEYPDFLSYDWKNYRWDGTGYHSALANAAKGVYNSTVGTAMDKIVEYGSSAWNYITNGTTKKVYSVNDKDFRSTTYRSLSEEQQKAIDKILEEGTTVDSEIKTKKQEKKAKEKLEKSIKEADALLNSYMDAAGNESETDATSTEDDPKYKLSLADDSDGVDDEEMSIIETLGQRQHFIQFYADPSATNGSRSISNSTQDTQLKSVMDTGSAAVKEIQFMANTGGVDTSQLQKSGDEMLKKLGEALGGTADNVSSTAGTLIQRLTGFAGNVIKGDKMIMPQIYSGTSQGSAVSVSIPLKCVYGNKYSLYVDFLVPLMHIIALAFPTATSANSYSSPFLVKCFMKGIFTCNMGIVSGISLSYSDTLNDDGLYLGATVTLEVTDLYPDIALTPPSSPLVFINNSSLIEYLATKCGLNLLESQFSTKVNLLINGLGNQVKDTFNTISSTINERLDEILQSYTGL